MKKLIVLFVFMLLATPALAHTPKKAPKSASMTLWSELCRGLELSAGYRWEPVKHRYRDTETESQFYVGAGVRLPLAPTVAIFTNYDHDFTEQNDWQARFGVSFMPLGGKY